MEIDSVVTLIIGNGSEFMGTLKEINERVLILDKPRLITVDEEGGPQIAPEFSFTGAAKVGLVEFSRSCFLCVVPSDSMSADAYQEHLVREEMEMDED